jgi:glyoxalase family protein
MLTLVDPDGMRIELVADPELSGRTGVPEDVAARSAIAGLHSVALSIADERPTRTLLANVMGLEPAVTRHGCCRLVASSDGPGRAVDLFIEPERASGLIGTGTVHHVAFRAADASQQRDWQRRLRDEGLDVTEVMDRRYFQSIYFHEPGGVRFEIATDSPGFSIDKSPALYSSP